MIETKDLVLDKAKFSDWEDMYKNVWSHPESARYMSWKVIKNEEDAKVRILKTIETQKTHDTYLVYEKASGQAIGFAGVFQMELPYTVKQGSVLGRIIQAKVMESRSWKGLWITAGKNYMPKRLYMLPVQKIRRLYALLSGWDLPRRQHRS